MCGNDRKGSPRHLAHRYKPLAHSFRTPHTRSHQRARALCILSRSFSLTDQFFSRNSDNAESTPRLLLLSCICVLSVCVCMFISYSSLPLVAPFSRRLANPRATYTTSRRCSSVHLVRKTDKSAAEVESARGEGRPVRTLPEINPAAQESVAPSI